MGQYEETKSETRVIPNPLYEKYSKLGGWLLAFVVMFIIAIPLAVIALSLAVPGFISLIPQLRELGHDFLISTMIISLIGSAIMMILIISFIVMVFQKNRHFLTPLIILVILEIPLFILTIMLVLRYPGSGNIVRELLYFARDVLFLGYFIKSVRVRTYMGTDEYLTKGPFSRLILHWFKPPVPEEPYHIVSAESSGIQPVSNQVPVTSVSPTSTADAVATVSAVEAAPVPLTDSAAPVPPPSPPAGWYPAPGSPGYMCWWDGQAWIQDSLRPQ